MGFLVIHRNNTPKCLLNLFKNATHQFGVALPNFSNQHPSVSKSQFFFCVYQVGAHSDNHHFTPSWESRRPLSVLGTATRWICHVQIGHSCDTWRLYISQTPRAPNCVTSSCVVVSHRLFNWGGRDVYQDVYRRLQGCPIVVR